ncbi:ABC transporter substrate-binding protein [Sinorhizobium meliloti]|uniref:ABC transporter substrate-binding protein n=1 Tax=Rhizobium meliloti TaxID=382 RepID=UPI0002F0BF93|nr:ABC transporter substrate-binding protein [Sinorhizobium meliloti]MBP2471031.1 sulfonate transport system substrate-binding protein [Sinorhizobium meliloti]MDE4553347.1 ABC transporter substrate-binding protein [Sinorhizobium meliloti]MDE4561656.1 ABC transporter substrate-binding protein [Sinorhizobium meliloti SM11]MDE4599646.1 ABC transporter substrate-binding protein [Sinorhizobium meliloti]WQP09342.1 ABC transporter substrate-binding protein [Sinorhizobium meliloti]
MVLVLRSTKPLLQSSSISSCSATCQQSLAARAGWSHEPIYLAVPIDSDIKSIDDVKGKKVALFKGTNLQLATDRVLSTHGLTEKDVRFINLDTSAAAAALTSGNVDAVFGGPEFLALAKKGIVKIAYTTKGDDPTLGRHTSYLVTAAFEQAHPDVTQRVVTTFIKAAAFASDPANKDEVFDGWSLSGFPKDAFEGDIEADTLANRLNPLIDDFIIARYKDQVARAKAYGLIKGDVDVDAWLEPKYLQQALKDLKLVNYWSSYDANGEIAKLGDLNKKQSNWISSSSPAPHGAGGPLPMRALDDLDRFGSPARRAKTDQPVAVFGQRGLHDLFATCPVARMGTFVAFRLASSADTARSRGGLGDHRRAVA